MASGQDRSFALAVGTPEALLQVFDVLRRFVAQCLFNLVNDAERRQPMPVHRAAAIHEAVHLLLDGCIFLGGDPVWGAAISKLLKFGGRLMLHL
ncbi:hypothetical protein ACFL6S_15305 [Candidatus Poribacteria bacterium]